MIGRRAFVVGGVTALAAPIAAGAQRTASVPRIGVLALLRFSDLTLQWDAFRNGLRDVGYIEGNILLEYRSADGQRDRLEDLAEELLRLHVAIIVSQTTPATAAATRATTKIPIVMLAVADPIGAGFIESLGRPGRNVTGFSLMLVDIGAKRLRPAFRRLRRSAQSSASRAAPRTMYRGARGEPFVT
jgi:putative ABC transport system substrate-binding protein